MALLDVHEVEADAPGEGGGIGEAVLKLLKIRVVQQGVVRRDVLDGVDRRDVLGQQRSGVAPAAGVGQLQADDQVVPAEALPVGRSGRGQQALEVGRRLRADEELARVRPPFGDDGGRFAPDELGAAGAEALPAAEGQFARAAVQGGVAALHGVDRQPVARGERADAQRLEEEVYPVGEVDLEPSPVDVGAKLVQGAIGEVPRHARLSPGSSRGVDSRTARSTPRRRPPPGRRRGYRTDSAGARSRPAEE